MTGDEVRAAVSTWLTLALDVDRDHVSDEDLAVLRDWIDGGCVGDLPAPEGRP